MTIANSDIAGTSPPRRLLVLSVPRTASNLLTKILNLHNQANVLTNDKTGYFFYPAFISTSRDPQLKNKPLDHWTDSQKLKVRAAFQQGLDGLEEYSARAQKENKIMFAKEHIFWILNPAAIDKVQRRVGTSNHYESFRLRIPETYGFLSSQTFSSLNETVLPDEYLRTWQLAFIIRHPALAWPSMYRSNLKISKAGFIDHDGVLDASLINMSLHWTRILYDWSLEQPDVQAPSLVMDAQDVIHNPQAVKQFCERAGLDTRALQFEWSEDTGNKKSDSFKTDTCDPLNNENDFHRVAASIFLSTLEASTGVAKDKTPANVDIAAEAQKWKGEFGEEVAQVIEKAVWDSMPDYEYLKARRITV